MTYTVSCSYYELYNEQITDLLQPSVEETLQVRVHPKRGPFIEHLSSEPVSTGEARARVPGMQQLDWPRMAFGSSPAVAAMQMDRTNLICATW